jgi:DamX protein
MDTETITALDDEIQPEFDERLISVAPFAPPSLSVSQFKQLELLQHLSLYSELLILFSGEKGMGKTFIAQALIASREDPDQSLLVDADFSLSYLDILHRIAQYIDLAELDDVEALESQIVQHCEQLQEDEQGSFLLVIDQADQLSNQVLMHLNQLALIQPNALHVMLLATPILEQVLLDLPEPHAPLHTMQVEFLSENEAEVILLEQFPEQDWSGEQVDYMLQQSAGSPGKLMYIARQLAAGVKEQNTKPAAKFPVTHVAAILLVASTLIVSFLYKNSQSELQDTVAVEVIAPVFTEVEELAKPDSLKPIEEIVAEEVDFNFIEPVQVAAVETVAANIKGQTSSTIPSPVAKTQEVNQQEAKSQSIKQVEPVVKSVIEPPVIEKAAATTKKVFSPNEQALLAALPSSFVAQLFGSYSQKSAKVFMQENKGAASLLSYRTEHKGKPWFVVVSGPFESRELAKKEVAKLPAKLRKQQPWVRSVEPVQELLNTRQ